MDERLIDLESRLAFQEHTLQELERVIFEQQRALDRLGLRLEAAEGRLRSLGESPLGRPEDEPPPPHY